MKNIIAALILGICIIIAGLLSGGIYTTTRFGDYPFLVNKITGNVKLPENFTMPQINH